MTGGMKVAMIPIAPGAIKELQLLEQFRKKPQSNKQQASEDKETPIEPAKKAEKPKVQKKKQQKAKPAARVQSQFSDDLNPADFDVPMDSESAGSLTEPIKVKMKRTEASSESDGDANYDEIDVTYRKLIYQTPLRQHYTRHFYKEPKLAGRYSEEKPQHYIYEKNLIEVSALNDEEMLQKFKLHTQQWTKWQHKKPIATDSKEAQDIVKNMVNDLTPKVLREAILRQEKQLKKKLQIVKQESKKPLYKKIKQPCQSKDLLPNSEFIAEGTGESNLNCCTVLGINSLLGNAWFHTVNAYLETISWVPRQNTEKEERELAQKDGLCLPLGNPFAVVHHQAHLHNVTLVPRAQFRYEEISEFDSQPMLLEIALALKSDVTRLGAVLFERIAQEDGTGFGDSSHFYTFQFDFNQQAWVMVLPPAQSSKITKELLNDIHFERHNSLKIYSLLSVGPKQKLDPKGKQIRKQLIASNGCDYKGARKFLPLARKKEAESCVQRVEFIEDAFTSRWQIHYYRANLKAALKALCIPYDQAGIDESTDEEDQLKTTALPMQKFQIKLQDDLSFCPYLEAQHRIFQNLHQRSSNRNIKKPKKKEQTSIEESQQRKGQKSRSEENQTKKKKKQGGDEQEEAKNDGGKKPRRESTTSRKRRDRIIKDEEDE